MIWEPLYKAKKNGGVILGWWNRGDMAVIGWDDENQVWFEFMYGNTVDPPDLWAKITSVPQEVPT